MPPCRRSPKWAVKCETGANGVADNLNSAGDSTDDFPLIGDCAGQAAAGGQRGRARHRRRRAEPRHDGVVAGVGAGAGRGRTADSVRRDAVAVPADPVLPPQVGCDHAGANAGRRAAAGDAGAGQPAAGQARWRCTPIPWARGAATTRSRYRVWPRSNCAQPASSGSAAQRFRRANRRSPHVCAPKSAERGTSSA